MKKVSLALLGIVLLMVLSTTVALAGPPNPPDYGNWNPTGLDLGPGDWEVWGVEKVKPPFSAPGGSVRVIRDPLVGNSDGWVTFLCQSKLGFQYNIGATGLNPLARYSVRAGGIRAIIVPPGTPDAIYIPAEGIWVVIDGLIDLDLGTFMTDANGLGGVRGVERLAAGFIYDVSVVVSDGDGVPVLSSPGDDTNGFLVY